MNTPTRLQTTVEWGCFVLKSITKKVTIVLLWLLLAVWVALTVLVLAGGVYTAVGLDTSLDEETFFSASADRTTRLYYEGMDGEITELATDRVSGYENALYCPLSEMPEHLKNAFIAIEDKRFYRHGGVDWLRTCSAAGDMLCGGERHFGGSTITQQLIKNRTGDTRRSVSRKLAELVRAAKLEEMLTKDEILEQYLNVVNLAENCYGVRTAANAYFSKEPSELTLREAATIAAITNNPTRYNPVRCPQANRQRRDVILAQMLEQEMITSEAFAQATAEPTALCLCEKAFTGRINSWFCDLVVADVIQGLMQERGMSEAAASRLVYGGGLRIYTTVDPDLQAAVERYYTDAEQVPKHENGKTAQSAILIADPRTGDILAVAGAVGEKKGNRIQNFATDTKRPSGSVIKPLAVYAPALERGLITWATVFDDIPHSFRANGAPWPRNSPDVYRGLTNVRTAVVQSVNTVCVSVLEQLGTSASLAFLRDKLGFVSLDETADAGAAALALGQQNQGVTLREVVAGYTALANQGLYTPLRSYARVEDNQGRVLLERESRGERVLSKENASILTMMLKQVVQSGTGKDITLGSMVDVAGKTGTSGNSCDKWFVGYTPELLAGVWYGHEYPESLRDVKGNPALHVFDRLMKQAVEIRGITQRHFTLGGDLVAVRYCKDSGKLLCDTCYLDPRGDRSEIGYFKRGTEPTAVCDCHVAVRYCKHGGVACPDCPEEECTFTALLRVQREFPRQIRVLDAPYTYGYFAPVNGRILSYNEPYYAASEETKHFYGVWLGIEPYNRICPYHTLSDDFWRRRTELSPKEK